MWIQSAFFGLQLWTEKKVANNPNPNRKKFKTRSMVATKRMTMQYKMPVVLAFYCKDNSKRPWQAGGAIGRRKIPTYYVDSLSLTCHIQFHYIAGPSRVSHCFTVNASFLIKK